MLRGRARDPEQLDRGRERERVGVRAIEGELVEATQEGVQRLGRGRDVVGPKLDLAGAEDVARRCPRAPARPPRRPGAVPARRGRRAARRPASRPAHPRRSRPRASAEPRRGSRRPRACDARRPGERCPPARACGGGTGPSRTGSGADGRARRPTAARCAGGAPSASAWGGRGPASRRARRHEPVPPPSTFRVASWDYHTRTLVESYEGPSTVMKVLQLADVMDRLNWVEARAGVQPS